MSTFHELVCLYVALPSATLVGCLSWKFGVSAPGAALVAVVFYGLFALAIRALMADFIEGRPVVAGVSMSRGSLTKPGAESAGCPERVGQPTFLETLFFFVPKVMREASFGHIWHDVAALKARGASRIQIGMCVAFQLIFLLLNLGASVVAFLAPWFFRKGL